MFVEFYVLKLQEIMEETSLERSRKPSSCGVENIEMKELLSSVLMEWRNQERSQTSVQGVNLNPTESKKDSICRNGKQRSKQIKYALVLTGLSTIIVSSVVIVTMLLEPLEEDKSPPPPKSTPECPKDHNTTKWMPMNMNLGSKVWNLCQHKSISLILTDDAIFENFPTLRCPENVKSLDIYTNRLTGVQFYILFEKFQHIRSISFIGARLSGSVDTRNAQHSQPKYNLPLKTRVTLLRFVGIENCGSIIQNVNEMSDMPCLKRIEFDCVVFSTADISAIYNLAISLDTLRDIHCSNANYCDGVFGNLQPSGVNIIVEEKYC